MVVKSLKRLTILFSRIMLHDRMIAWHMMLWLCIQVTWYWHVNYLTLICLYSTPETQHLIPNTWYLRLILDTWYLTPDIWYLTIDKLSLDTWHMLSLGTDTLDLMLWHLTGQYYTWHLYYIAYSWLSLLRELDMIIILLPGIWYSWTLVLLNSCIPCTHVRCTVTLVSSTVIPASGGVCLVSGWRGCIPWSR